MRDPRRARLEPLPPLQQGLLALGVVLLAALVAAASRPGDAGPAAPPGADAVGATVFHALAILATVGEVAVVGLLAWALWPGRHRRIRSRGGIFAVAAASFLQAASALILFWLYLRWRLQVHTGGGGSPLSGIILFRPPLPGVPDRAGAVPPGVDWIAVALAGAVVVVVAYRVFRGAFRGRRRSRSDRLFEQLQEAVAEGLEGLEAEPDPRRAVIAAYARMERSLARAGIPRQPQETAFEYLDRLLGLLEVRGSAPRRLTDLFQVARFSRHPVDESMKRAAIQALGEIRDELRERASDAPPAGFVAA